MNAPAPNLKRILIVNTFGIGDVLFTTPLIRNIKANLPGCFLGVVCNQRARGILLGNPYIDKILVFEKDYYRHLAGVSRIKCLREFNSFFKAIKKERFDLCIDLSLSSQVGFFVWLSGIKKRMGYNYKNRGWLLNDGIPFDGYADKHVVEFYLDLLRHWGLQVTAHKLEIFLSDREKKWGSDFLKDNGVSDNDLLIAIIPGGGASWGKDAPIKHWPGQKFGQLADKCIEKFKAKIIILGDSKDTTTCLRALKEMKGQAVYACGNTDLRQFAALLNHCHLVITNDGGPLHVAVAVGAKTVSLFGPVDEKVYGPYPYDLSRHRVVKKELNCRPCYRNFKMADCNRRICLEEIDVDEVLREIEEIK